MDLPKQTASKNSIFGLLKQVIIYSFGGTYGRLITILLSPVYTKVFSQQEYGVIDLLSTITFILTMVLMLGLIGGVTRFYIDENNAKEKESIASTGLIFIFLFSSIFIFLCLPFLKTFSAFLLNDPEYYDLLLLTLITMPFHLALIYIVNMFVINFKPKHYAIVSFSSMVFQIVLTLVMIYKLQLDLHSIYIARLATVILFTMVCFYMLRQKFALVFSIEKLKKMVTYGAPEIIYMVSLYLLLISDRYFIKFFWGLDQVGLYGAACALSYGINFVVIGFQRAWLPFVFSTYNNEDSKLKYAKVFNYTSVFLCMVFLAISIFAKEALQIFATKTYVEAYKTIPFIVGGTTISFIGAYFSMGINIKGKTMVRAWAGLVSIIFNLIMNYLLIPTYGILGAAIATFLSFLLLTGIMLYYSQKYYLVAYQFLKNLILYAIAYLLIFYSYFLLPERTGMNFMLKFFVLIFFIPIPFVMRLIHWKDLKLVIHMAAKKIFKLNSSTCPSES